jgi:3-oxoacyl-[acyl-carrier-protein] synthase II
MSAGAGAAPSTELVVTGLGVSTPWTDQPADLPVTNGGAPDGDEWFDVASQLGPRGYRYLPPACRYLLAAARRAATAAGDPLAGVAPQRRAAVVGTNTAVRWVLSDLDSTVTGDGYEALSPAMAPFFSVNVVAGRLAIDHAIRGATVTLTTPAVAGLAALASGRRAAASGRASAVLVGATEATPACGGTGASPPRGGPGATPARGVPEAGAAVLVLESPSGAAERGVRPAGRVRVVTLFAPSTMDRDRWIGHTRRAVDGLLAGLGPVAGAHLVSDGSRAAALLGEEFADRSAVRELPAGSGCLTPLLIVARLLATAEGTHLVGVATGTGHVAVAAVEGASGA